MPTPKPSKYTPNGLFFAATATKDTLCAHTTPAAAQRLAKKHSRDNGVITFFMERDYDTGLSKVLEIYQNGVLVGENEPTTEEQIAARFVRLEGLRRRVLDAHLADNRSFWGVLQSVIETLSIPDKLVATELQVSLPTARRWIRGVSAPAEPMREPVRRFLLEQIHKSRVAATKARVADIQHAREKVRDGSAITIRVWVEPSAGTGFYGHARFGGDTFRAPLALKTETAAKIAALGLVQAHIAEGP